MAETNPSPPGPNRPVTTVSTADLGTNPALSPAEQANQLYGSQGIPNPQGTTQGEQSRAQAGQNTDPTGGVGVDGEVIVWEARYSLRNFIGRLVFRCALTIAWIGLAVYTWGQDHEKLEMVTWAAGAAVLLLWLTLIWRIVQAWYSHYYKLSNRRLFVSTGILQRRRDMLELLKVKDVFTRQQSLIDRWISLGTVVVVPHEKDLPTFYLTGVSDPKGVMDLIWHHARAERDQRSVKVENV